ncbi:hypothetical protein [Streptococcus sp. S784/96/1]|uniref:hypothetical protein n=1 Tax=Streptococcus sp. S784/96/1 TaxID=2653499 RepID=UPI001386610B|nr:hypothetical protein [Streptococcus sp. S784/96/1]
MIEMIKQETVNVLTDALLIGVEDNSPRPAFEGRSVSRRFCLQLVRNYQQDRKELFPEAAEECKIAYQEISDMADREFELLYQELLTVRV